MNRRIQPKGSGNRQFSIDRSNRTGGEASHDGTSFTQSSRRAGSCFFCRKDVEHGKFSCKSGSGRQGTRFRSIAKAADYIVENSSRPDCSRDQDDGSYTQAWMKWSIKRNEVVSQKYYWYYSGINQKLSDESVVICAHYDHLGLGWREEIQGMQEQYTPCR